MKCKINILYNVVIVENIFHRLRESVRYRVKVQRVGTSNGYIWKLNFICSTLISERDKH